MRRKGRGAGPEPPGGSAKYGDDEGGTLHQGVRERARVFETVNFFLKGLMLRYCARFLAT